MLIPFDIYVYLLSWVGDGVGKYCMTSPYGCTASLHYSSQIHGVFPGESAWILVLRSSGHQLYCSPTQIHQSYLGENTIPTKYTTPIDIDIVKKN